MSPIAAPLDFLHRNHVYRDATMSRSRVFPVTVRLMHVGPYEDGRFGRLIVLAAPVDRALIVGNIAAMRLTHEYDGADALQVAIGDRTSPDRVEVRLRGTTEEDRALLDAHWCSGHPVAALGTPQRCDTTGAPRLFNATVHRLSGLDAHKTHAAAVVKCLAQQALGLQTGVELYQVRWVIDRPDADAAAELVPPAALDGPPAQPSFFGMPLSARALFLHFAVPDARHQHGTLLTLPRMQSPSSIGTTTPSAIPTQSITYETPARRRLPSAAPPLLPRGTRHATSSPQPFVSPSPIRIAAPPAIPQPLSPARLDLSAPGTDDVGALPDTAGSPPTTDTVTNAPAADVEQPALASQGFALSDDAEAWICAVENGAQSPQSPPATFEEVTLELANQFVIDAFGSKAGQSLTPEQVVWAVDPAFLEHPDVANLIARALEGLVAKGTVNIDPGVDLHFSLA